MGHAVRIIFSCSTFDFVLVLALSSMPTGHEAATEHEAIFVCSFISGSTFPRFEMYAWVLDGVDF